VSEVTSRTGEAGEKGTGEARLGIVPVDGGGFESASREETVDEGTEGWGTNGEDIFGVLKEWFDRTDAALVEG